MNKELSSDYKVTAYKIIEEIIGTVSSPAYPVAAVILECLIVKLHIEITRLSTLSPTNAAGT